MSRPGPAGRAGIQDPRNATFVTNLHDLERQQHRPKQLKVETTMLRLEDLEEVRELRGAEPMGKAPAPLSVASRMIVFFGPKGGTGATTLAINVGGALARLGRDAVVVDLDLQLGAVPVSLNMKPERSVAEVTREAVAAGSGPLQSGLDRHFSGLCVVAQGDRIEELGEVTAERLPRFFDALGQAFPYVVVDGLRDFSDHAVAAMDLAHQVALVVTQDVPAVRAAARALRIFRRLGYGPERLRIVLNRYHPKSPVTVAAIQNALGQAVDAVVHNDFPLVEQALNHGALLYDLKPAARVTQDVRGVARLLAGMPPEPPPAGLLARFLPRRR